MSAIDEASLWDRLSNARKIPLNPTWLGEIFSPSLSDELRFAVAERLGMLAETGWPIIQTLIQQHGICPELTMQLAFAINLKQRIGCSHN